MINSTETKLSNAPTWGLALIVSLFIGNFLGLVLFGYHYDEAYYWMLSQHLGLSYYDHPPMVPWMIRFFTSLFNDNTWALRAPAVLAWFTAAWVVFKLSTHIFKNSHAGWLAVLVFSSIPIYQVGFHMVGPDSGLMLFTALAYYFAIRAVENKTTLFWLAAGLATGAGLLAKYNSVLVPAAIFLALLLAKRGRQELKTPWPWMAGAISLICFLPVVVWNYQNEWASFIFQWAHGTNPNSGTWLDNIVYYIVNQMGVVLPWVFIAMVVAAARARKFSADQREFSLTLVQAGFWLPLVFFGIAGLASKGHASWPAMAYITGSILLGGQLGKWLANQEMAVSAFRASRNWIKGAIIFAALFSLIFLNLLRFPQWKIWFEKDVVPRGQAATTMGWQRLADSVETIRKLNSATAGKRCRIMTVPGFDDGGIQYHYVAAEIGLHLGDAYLVASAPGSVPSQFDYWRREETSYTPPVCVVVTGASKSSDMPSKLHNDLGYWQRTKLVDIHTPDGSVRWYGIYSSATLKPMKSGQFSK